MPLANCQKVLAMNQTSPVPTQPEPEHLAHAGDILEAILLTDLDLEARITVGAALAVLADVYPPYPPRPRPTDPIDLCTGLTQAHKALTAAVDAADSVQEAIRAGLAGRELQHLRDRP
jgi:hypothetical protein